MRKQEDDEDDEEDDSSQQDDAPEPIRPHTTKAPERKPDVITPRHVSYSSGIISISRQMPSPECPANIPYP